MGRGEEGWREGGRRRERVEGRSMVGGREGGRKGRGDGWEEGSEGSLNITSGPDLSHASWGS